MILQTGCLKDITIPGTNVNLQTALVSIIDIPNQNQVYTIYPEGYKISPNSAPQDGHYSVPRFEAAKLKGDTLSFRANIHRDAGYQISDLGNVNEVNKLFGFTDCDQMDPKIHSARFGWISTPNSGNQPGKDGSNTILVLPYIDNNNTHQYDMSYKTALEIKLDTFYKYQIQINGNSYTFTIWDDEGNQLLNQTKNRNCGSTNQKWILSPYFGGPIPAPWAMNIEVDIL